MRPFLNNVVCCTKTTCISVGLPYVHHRERGHFPFIDHEKEDISAEGKVNKRDKVRIT